jgi:hypothetical protein
MIWAWSAGMDDSFIVMYAGKIFERARQWRFQAGRNPYTEGLADVRAESAVGTRRELYQIPGYPRHPNILPRLSVCSALRSAQDLCRREFPRDSNSLGTRIALPLCEGGCWTNPLISVRDLKVHSRKGDKTVQASMASAWISRREKR